MKKKRKQSKTRVPLWVRISIVLVWAVGVMLIINTAFSVMQKPTEVLSVFSPKTSKPISETWNDYEDLFVQHSTRDITPSFLAALAQTESGGRPWASPSWISNSFFAFAPPSSSVGLMQFTDDTFKRASRYCIHSGEVKSVGPWHSMDSCWFNGFNNRLSASDSIEVTSAYLSQTIDELAAGASKARKLKTAAIAHLCGKRKAKRFVASGFDSQAIGKCGKHSPKRYIRKVYDLSEKFSKLRLR